MSDEPCIVVAVKDVQCREQMMQILEKFAMPLYGVSSKEQAQAILSSKNAVLLLWDAGFMSSPSGLYALRVLWLVPENDRAVKRQALGAGARAVVELPLEATELELRVQQQLSQLNAERMIEMQKEILREELQQATVHLVESERLSFLGTLSGGVGHELNNLAQIMRGILDRLQQEGETDSAAEFLAPQKAVQNIVQDLTYAYEHLHMHAKHLQNLGRPQEAQFEPFFLGDVVDRVLKNAKLSGRLKSVRVKVFGLCDKMRVKGSAQRIGQVFNNLLQNGADAALAKMRPMGENAEVEISFFLEEKDILIAVQDNGAGIAEQDLEKVFRPYFTTKPQGQGTGLGLSVVQRILKEHDTSLEFNNNNGACFSFRLARFKIESWSWPELDSV